MVKTESRVCGMRTRPLVLESPAGQIKILDMPSVWRFPVRSHNISRLAALACLAATTLPAAAATNWWSDTADQALTRAGTNQATLTRALTDVPEAQREGMQFLVENMPDRDLRTLSANYLLSHVAQSYDAFEKAPWRAQIPKEIFLNEILPYACNNEVRDEWFKKLRDLSLPLIADCKTPGEVAQRLNEKLFPLVNVKYSTQRAKAIQSPLETMQSGLATCSGLSILLVDACRSVGVPARVTGTPLWTDNSGNHCWVEVWDNGAWHFTGAAEPDPKGLDHGWFEQKASTALKDSPRNAIYSSSFKKTGVQYPGWIVGAVNVTERYATKVAPDDPEKFRVMVKVLDQLSGKRVAAKVTVTDIADSSIHFAGTSREETADMNDHLPFQLPRGHTYEIRAERDGLLAGRYYTAAPPRTNANASTNAQPIVLSIAMKESTVFEMPKQSYTPPAVTALKAADEAKLNKALADYFAAPAKQQASWKFSGSFDALLRDNEPAVRRAAWEAYKAAPIHADAKADFDTNQVRFQEYLSPYVVKSVGTRPASGWPLFIAMHGGGNAGKQVNDSQWRQMQMYYKDHPEVGGYKYLALRAPNDTWNGFYDVYVYPMIANLIRQFTVFGDVDPNKVFIMGYSHGGYGAFAIGPKEPDLFAAIHASAGAPTDGETTGKTLRNSIFTCMVGEKDTAYGRFERDQKFVASINEFRGDRKDIYPVIVQFIPDAPHSGLPDRDKIREMYSACRNPVPRELTWLMTDKVITDFFWIRTDAPDKQMEFDALCRDNKVTVSTTPNLTTGSVLLDARLVDFKKPVVLDFNGKTTSQKLQPSLKTLCETLVRRGDPELAFTAELSLPLATSTK